jgi:hypothetical protein
VASVGKLEGAGVAAEALVDLLPWIAAGGLVLWIAYKFEKGELPAWLYPQTAWSYFASGVDGVFYDGPLRGINGGPTQNAIDKFLAAVFGWLVDHTPAPPVSPGGSGSAPVETGSDGGY